MAAAAESGGGAAQQSFATRRRANQQVLGGLRANSLLGVKWRFVDRNQLSTDYADLRRASQFDSEEAVYEMYGQGYQPPHKSFVDILRENAAQRRKGGEAELPPAPARRRRSGDSDADIEEFTPEELAAIRRKVDPKFRPPPRRARERQPGKLPPRRKTSPPPVVIWRPTTRVRVAEDVPPRVRSVYRTGSGGGSSGEVAAPEAAEAVKQKKKTKRKKKKHFSSSADRIAAPTDEQLVKKRELERQRAQVLQRKKAREAYSRWYMPPDHWQRVFKGETHNAEQKEDMYLDKKERHLRSKIPTLFITSAYKDWLAKRGERRPSYLRDARDEDEDRRGARASGSDDEDERDGADDDEREIK